MCFTTRSSEQDIHVPARPISTGGGPSRPTSRIAVITPPHSHSHSLSTLPQPIPKRSYSQSRAPLRETRRLSSGQLVTVHTISPRTSGTKVTSPRQSGNLRGASPRLSGNLHYYGGSPRHSANAIEAVTTSPRQSKTVVITPRQSGSNVHFRDEVEVMGDSILNSRPVVRSRRRSSLSGGGGGGYKSPRQSSASVRSVSYRSTREKMVEVDEGGGGRGYRYERRDDPRR